MHASTALRALDLHQTRRNVALPTLSVIVGSECDLTPTWVAWARRQQRPSFFADPTTPLKCWCEQWRTSQCGFDTLAELFNKKTEYEFVTLLSNGPRKSRLEASEIRALYRFLRGDDGLLQQSLDASGTDHLRVLLCLATLIDGPHLPALAVSATPNSPAMGALLTSLYRLVSKRPTLPVALLLTPQQHDSIQQDLAESREKAFLREGLLVLSGGSEADVRQALDDAGIEATPILQSIRCLTRLAPTHEMIRDFVGAVRNLNARDANPGRPATEFEGKARSHAERLLFACLQRLPETAGLFQLNAKLPIRFGHAMLEADLLASSVGLVVEIDGYYHFQSAEAYRRDRRKDFVLQRHGFLVMRLLADDVVGQLETMLDTIKSLLVEKRAVQPDAV